jgi:ubiquinone biosynthesis protein UbiJ
MADDLVHAYDASKRREYYLRTRKLKGRQPGKAAPPKKTRAQRQAERRKKLEAQVEALKGRLEKLRAVLAQLTEQAKKRSGVDTKKTTSKKTTSSTKKAAEKKLTPAQKAKAAKASEEYRKKNPEKALADDVKSLNDKIKTIQERIAKMRKEGSIGAKKTTT